MEQAASCASHPLSEPLSNGAYIWHLTPQEREHISSMLDLEGWNVNRSTNRMNRNRAICTSCGKHSGLDDLVQNALKLQIHSKDFIKNVLRNGPERESPNHLLQCSRCGEMSKGEFGWDWKDKGQFR